MPVSRDSFGGWFTAEGSRAYLFALFLGYIALVRYLRIRRRDALADKYNMRTRADLATMSSDTAFAIHRDLLERDFPSYLLSGLSVALFKAFAIPSISRVLLASGEITGDMVSKRTVDTAVLVVETLFNHPLSDRSLSSIARMNYLHGRWRRAGKITNDDMLYTLSLFTLEPIRAIDDSGWRPLTDIERTAVAIMWRDIGQAMDTSYDKLEMYLEKDGDLGDGLTWLAAISAWSHQYELTHAVPAETNIRIARAALDMVFKSMPSFVHGFVEKVLGVRVGGPVRKATGLEEPDAIHRIVLSTASTLNKWFIGYLLPPRPSFLRIQYFTPNKDEKTGKYHKTSYVSDPWYVKPKFWSRWSPSAVLRRLSGGNIPGDNGNRFRPAGYLIQDIGPLTLEGKGGKEMEQNKLDIRAMKAASGRCPMSALAGSN